MGARLGTGQCTETPIQLVTEHPDRFHGVNVTSAFDDGLRQHGQRLVLLDVGNEPSDHGNLGPISKDHLDGHHVTASLDGRCHVSSGKGSFDHLVDGPLGVIGDRGRSSRVASHVHEVNAIDEENEDLDGTEESDHQNRNRQSEFDRRLTTIAGTFTEVEM